MIKGIFLAISTSAFFTSLSLIIMGSSGLMQENLLTGAVVGVKSVVSYSVITLIISFLVSMFLLINITKKDKFN